MSAKIFQYRQAHSENFYLFAIWVPSPWLHHTHTRTPLANVRHCLPLPAAFGFRLLESSVIVPFRTLSESIQHSIITSLSHRLGLLLLFLSTLTLSAAFLLFCACFICIGLRAERSGSVGALALNGRKCGGSRFERSKVWEFAL